MTFKRICEVKVSSYEIDYQLKLAGKQILEIKRKTMDINGNHKEIKGIHNENLGHHKGIIRESMEIYGREWGS